jgi:hypothetical protein
MSRKLSATVTVRSFLSARAVVLVHRGVLGLLHWGCHRTGTASADLVAGPLYRLHATLSMRPSPTS